MEFLHKRRMVKNKPPCSLWKQGAVKLYIFHRKSNPISDRSFWPQNLLTFFPSGSHRVRTGARAQEIFRNWFAFNTLFYILHELIFVFYSPFQHQYAERRQNRSRGKSTKIPPMSHLRSRASRSLLEHGDTCVCGRKNAEKPHPTDPRWHRHHRAHSIWSDSWTYHFPQTQCECPSIRPKKQKIKSFTEGKSPFLTLYTL